MSAVVDRLASRYLWEDVLSQWSAWKQRYGEPPSLLVVGEDVRPLLLQIEQTAHVDGGFRVIGMDVAFA